MSAVIPGSSGVTEPAVSQIRAYLLFYGYNRIVYQLLSPDTVTLYGRKQAFVFQVLERFSSRNKVTLRSLLETTVRNGEY